MKAKYVYCQKIGQSDVDGVDRIEVNYENGTQLHLPIEALPEPLRKMARKERNTPRCGVFEEGTLFYTLACRAASQMMREILLGEPR